MPNLDESVIVDETELIKLDEKKDEGMWMIEHQFLIINSDTLT